MIVNREAVLTIPFRLLSTIRWPTSKYWSILLSRDREYSGRGVGWGWGSRYNQKPVPGFFPQG